MAFTHVQNPKTEVAFYHVYHRVKDRFEFLSFIFIFLKMTPLLKKGEKFNHVDIC